MSDTTDPKRLLSDGGPGASSFERELLSAGTTLTPPANMDARVWGALAAEIGALGVLAGVATTGTATGAATGAGTALTGAAAGANATVGIAAGGTAAKAGLGFAAKVGVAMVALGFAAGGTYATQRFVAGRSAAPRLSVTVPQTLETNDSPPLAMPLASSPVATLATTEPDPSSAPTLASARPAPGEPGQRGGTKPAEATDPRPVPSAASTASATPTTTLSEAQYLQTARSCIARGDTRCAREAMSKASAAGGTGLSEEREALAVRLAFAEGRQAEGKSLARAFVQAHPKSPLAAAMAELGK